MLVPNLITTVKDYSRARFVTDSGADGEDNLAGTIDEVLAQASALPPLSDAATFPP
ncbi:MAG: hypothetical protein ACREOF_20805 [Gemmatimonadales bacterium]